MTVKNDRAQCASSTSRLGPLSLLHGLHALWCARVISQDALFLGAQVCQRMLEAKATHVVHTGTQAQTHFTTLSDAIYTGPIVKDLSTYSIALQDLHFRGHLFNDLVLPDLNDPDTGASHFSLSPNWVAGDDYDMDTFIHYQIAPMTRADFFVHVNKLVGASLGTGRPYSFDLE